jgi:4-amino-4-deoxy-L-arabinose transferase-like glycosyltransferase
LAIDQTIEGTGRAIDGLHRRAVLAGLLALCVFTYLPGLLRLPAVDRTEIVFAETTRAMVERDDWLDPRYRGAAHQFRPIGTFWAQGAVAILAGEAYARDIRIHRIPGFLAVTLSVLALFWLAAPLIGTAAAGWAAGLFAVAPLTVLLSQLAIADGLALLPATVALVALMRIHAASENDDTLRLALLFWAAAGFGMFVNALHTPILVATTLIALFVFERDLSWLRRLHIIKGLPLAVTLASPWMIVRFQQDGVPFSGMDFGKFLAALGGAQDMKLRAFPGTFAIAALLGFLPGTALLAPALKRLWDGRAHQRVARFLLAWIIGYIVYLEALSSKPGTYTVQVMFPAMALAVALLITRHEGASPLRWHALLWPPLAALYALVLFALPYAALREMPPVWILPPMVAVAALFALSAARGRAGQLQDWAKYGIAGLSLFAVTLIAGALPAIDRIWPAHQITRALEGCAPGPVAVAGFREPSAYFVLGSDETLLEPDALRAALVEGRATYVASDVRDDKVRTLSRGQYRRLKPLACVEAFNTMRGCPLFFTIQTTGSPESCPARAAFPCTEDFITRAQAARQRPGCD